MSAPYYWQAWCLNPECLETFLAATELDPCPWCEGERVRYEPRDGAPASTIRKKQADCSEFPLPALGRP